MPFGRENGRTFSRVALLGQARHEAPDEVASELAEALLAPAFRRLSLPRGILAGLTGILKRRFYPRDYLPSQAAAAAAERLFHKLSFDRHRLNLIYSTSVCRDHVEPSTASIVQCRLGLTEAGIKNLDLGNACLGFMDGLELAALQIEAGLIEYALVVAGENSRPVFENTVAKLNQNSVDRQIFFNNFATLTLGSGGAAAILGPAEKHPGAPRLRSLVSLSDVASNHLCRGDHQGMETDSAKLLKAGVALAEKTFQTGAARFGWTRETFARLICHQVSQANIRAFCQALGLPGERLVKTYPEYGNMGPVAVPFTLDLAEEQGLLLPGDRVALMGIGSGLAVTMMELQYL